MARLLIVHHSPTPNLAAILDSVVAGATHEDIEGVEVLVRQALLATVEDVLSADGYIIGTSANIGYISGAVKHFFDQTFDQASQDPRKTPFSYYVHGRSDTSGAERAMESISTGLGWVKVSEPVCFLGEPTPDHLAAVSQLGSTVAATLAS
ncbi:flavodoxin family protein [Aeromicrobium chenweiae]|uniref:Flavodoxin n=1 Tax=Aeromicrobium chenweiae TaxID=2079793 RepID=A0A2S0WKG1_9ACTN|nr:flavodoxin [Aeromicrobium chenweiae]AWB91787.1 flavodoxin [Aeromicrobium chenweiae]TGN32631.1 flavodoxin family protein [Aeromicrobium chenweiae]